MSVQAAQSSNPRDAVTLAESALSAAKQLTPAVAASLYGRLALGAAYVGDGAACQRAQKRSFELLGQSVPEEEPPWIYWFNQADAEGLAGWSLLALGRPTEAESHLRRAVATIDPAFARDRSGMLLDLATARLDVGAAERACATAGEAAAIIRRLDSPREKRILADFRRAAAPYATSAAVREFDAKHRDLVGPSLA
jgi:tetratricopeptide (TPR) repeat protein